MVMLLLVLWLVGVLMLVVVVSVMGWVLVLTSVVGCEMELEL